MNENPFQHIDLRVNDLDKAHAFYTKILPAIGFPEGWSGDRFRGFDAEGIYPNRAWFGFTEDKSHRPNANRISFWAESRERVDELGEILAGAGAYYAVFFEDPFGNCLEICYRED